MTHPNTDLETFEDLRGSIFLPKSLFPEREFESWKFQLLLGRGIAAGRTTEEILNLHDELVEVRSRYLGTLAIDTV